MLFRSDPLIRWMVSPDAPADLGVGSRIAADGANVAWLGRATRPQEAWVTGIGDDAAATAHLVEQLADENPIDGVTVSEAVFPLLPPRLQSPDPGRWCLWTLDPGTWDSGRFRGAVELDLDDPRIARLLQHSTSAHTFPGDPRIVRWAGVEDEDRLLSVAGMTWEPSGAAHLLSVCTEPAHRGRGLAQTACALLIDRAVEEGAPIIVLEMYTANESGRRAYSALGFSEVGRYCSGLLEHALRDVPGN